MSNFTTNLRNRRGERKGKNQIAKSFEETKENGREGSCWKSSH